MCEDDDGMATMAEVMMIAMMVILIPTPHPLVAHTMTATAMSVVLLVIHAPCCPDDQYHEACSYKLNRKSEGPVWQYRM